MAVVEKQQELSVLPSRRVSLALDRLLADGLAIVWGVALTAWALILFATVTGQQQLLDHSILMQPSASPWSIKLLIFLSAWQVMIAAMMLPTTLPMVRLFARSSRGQPQKQLALLSFLAAYAIIWSGFALLILVGDLGLHQLFASWHWLHTQPWRLEGLTLLLAGAFQFSPLKSRCMQQCQDPVSFLMQYYQRGLQAAWTLGFRHGLYCLGCCWALMLVMCAVGMGNLSWMLGLTGVMLLEKTSSQGQWLVPVVGVTLIVWGGIVLLQPS